jgi:hypothetical protein
MAETAGRRRHVIGNVLVDEPDLGTGTPQVR